MVFACESKQHSQQAGKLSLLPSVVLANRQWCCVAGRHCSFRCGWQVKLCDPSFTHAIPELFIERQVSHWAQSTEQMYNLLHSSIALRNYTRSLIHWTEEHTVRDRMQYGACRQLNIRSDLWIALAKILPQSNVLQWQTQQTDTYCYDGC